VSAATDVNRSWLGIPHFLALRHDPISSDMTSTERANEIRPARFGIGLKNFILEDIPPPESIKGFPDFRHAKIAYGAAGQVDGWHLSNGGNKEGRNSGQGCTYEQAFSKTDPG